MMAFLDDSLETFGFFGKGGCLLLLDADGIVCKQLFLCGLEFTLVAKLRETGCDLLCGHLLLLGAKAHGKALFGRLDVSSHQYSGITLLEGFEREVRAEFQPTIWELRASAKPSAAAPSPAPALPKLLI